MPEIAQIPLSQIAPICGGSVLHQRDAAVLITVSEQHGFSAEAMFDLPGIEREARILNVRLAVETGSLGFGWLSRDESAWVAHAFSPSTTALTDITLVIPEGTEGGRLVFDNATGDGGRAVARIVGISVTADDPPSYTSPEGSFGKLVADCLPDRFTLIDIGCSGGIASRWRVFGDNLEAFCFDPNLEELKRLSLAEDFRGVSYFPGFVAAPRDHPFLQLKNGGPDISRNPWSRLALVDSITRQAEVIARASTVEKTARNDWHLTELSSPAQVIHIPDFLDKRGVRSVDFVKLDIDGKDFEVLHSLADIMDGHQILGFFLEVNFIGSASPTEHCFHNTDRLMRAQGYDLYDIASYRYAQKHMPARYVNSLPGRSIIGRPYQGDALYMRDICAEYNADFARRLSPAKKAKAAALFSLFSLPDCAAEILDNFEAELGGFIDIARARDILARQAQDLSQIRGPHGCYMSYREFIEAFRENSPVFYPRAGLSKGPLAPWRPLFHYDLPEDVGRLGVASSAPASDVLVRSGTSIRFVATRPQDHVITEFHHLPTSGVGGWVRLDVKWPADPEASVPRCEFYAQDQNLVTLQPLQMIAIETEGGRGFEMYIELQPQSTGLRVVMTSNGGATAVLPEMIEARVSALAGT